MNAGKVRKDAIAFRIATRSPGYFKEHVTVMGTFTHMEQFNTRIILHFSSTLDNRIPL